MMKDRPTLRTCLWSYSTSNWQKVKEKVAIMKTNGLEIFLQPCTQVSIFVLHFIALFLFSDPIRKKPTLKNISHTTKGLSCRVRPKQGHNKQEKTLKHSEHASTKKKIGFALPRKKDNRMTTPYLSAAATTSLSDKSHFLKVNDRQFQSQTFLPQPCQV